MTTTTIKFPRGDSEVLHDAARMLERAGRLLHALADDDTADTKKVISAIRANVDAALARLP